MMNFQLYFRPMRPFITPSHRENDFETSRPMRFQRQCDTITQQPITSQSECLNLYGREFFYFKSVKKDENRLKMRLIVFFLPGKHVKNITCCT